MSETTPAEQPQDRTGKQLATLGLVLGLLATGAALCGGAVAPVQSRVDRLESQQHESSRDQTEVLQRITRLEEGTKAISGRVGDNTRILRRVESWMERHQ